jgi:PAS domain S-box-containing protein
MNNSQQLVKILVVEDDEDDFFLISAYFSNIKVWTFEIKWVQRYAEALEELYLNSYTLCFCDYSLGAKNGIDLIKDGRAKNIVTPVILLTGKGNYNIDIEATKAGAFDYLIKAELDEDKLERTIRYTLERIRSLQIIQENERRYRSIFEKSKDIVFIARPDTTITNINYAVADILHFNVEDCTGKQLIAFIKNPADMEHFFMQLNLNGEIENYEIDFVTALGEIKTCLISASVEVDSDNEAYLQGIIHDITDLKKAEKSSLQAEKLAASGRFILTLAHEVRNPLNNIKLATENLLETIVNEEDHFFLDIIQRNSQRINDLITELLQSSRPADINLSEVSLNGLLDKVIATVQDKLTLRNITLNINYDYEDAILKADGVKLEMAILNILVNAIEAVQDGTGLIEVKTITRNNHAALMISDNGYGISSENKDKLFEPYFTSKRNGIGLGLATTFNILQSHNAKIEVQSHINAGTIFTVRFAE